MPHLCIGYLSPTRTFIGDMMAIVGNRAYGVQLDPTSLAISPGAVLRGIIIDACDPVFVADLPQHLPDVPLLLLDDQGNQRETVESFIQALDLSGHDPTWLLRPPDSEAMLSQTAEA